MTKNGMPKGFGRSVMSLFEGARTIIIVNSELSEDFDVKVGLHQGYVLSPFRLFSRFQPLRGCGRCCHLIGQRGCAK